MGYVYLALAIVLELAGTTLLKFSNGFTTLLPSVATVVAYSSCFFFFSKCLLTVSLSVAYAMWSGIGIVFATSLSALYFQERLTGWMTFGIVCILVGVVVLNVASAK